MNHAAIIAFLLMAAVLAAPTDVIAQRVEVGGSMGLGLPGSENSLVRGDAVSMSGAHAGVWWGDRVVTAFRMAWGGVPYPEGSAGYFVGCGPGTGPNCTPEQVNVIFGAVVPRRYIGAEVIYYFRSGERMRPFAGGGYGRMDTSEDVRCEVPGCEALMGPTFRFGRRTSSAANPIAVGGVSWSLTDHVLVHGAARFHRFGGEELSRLELGIGAGWRF